MVCGGHSRLQIVIGTALVHPKTHGYGKPPGRNGLGGHRKAQPFGQSHGRRKISFGQNYQKFFTAPPTGKICDALGPIHTGGNGA